MADEEVFGQLSRFGRKDDDDGDDPNAEVIAEMRKNRRVNRQRMGVSSGGGGAELSFATGRPRDPMFYWKQNNLPWDYNNPDELIQIRDYCRVVYSTHSVIGAAIDVFAKFPLTGMELKCKDPALTEFYEDLFFGELDYEEFLVDIGREYWTVGEAWPLGSFNETLGIWEDDELMNPNGIDVIQSPFLKEPRFEMQLPENLRKIINDREPKWEFEALMRSYPELKNFLGEDARMPVSNILMRQLKFRGDTFHPRGIPILLRGFRPVMQEEMLNAAQDAIASRLYTPLILAKLGASATDLGTQQPWIPSEKDLADFEEAIDAALAADFRILTHHFGVQMDSVFGRESMPNFDRDFERLTEKQLQVFGLSKTMLSGAGRGETYAADAINRDLISQLLSVYQRLLKRFFRDRALVVAEAQEHYDYEERGGKRYPVFEEVLEINEETGEQVIVEQPKLLVPDLEFRAMTMKDETDQRQFMEALKEAGVPISMKTRLVNTAIDVDEEVEQTRQEQIDLAVAAQETRRQTYEALRDAALPVPQDLKDDFEPKVLEDGSKAEEEPIPTIGREEVEPELVGLSPTSEDFSPNGEPESAEPYSPVNKLPRNRIMERTRPEESDEMRADMPKPAQLRPEQLRRVVSKVDEEGNVVSTEEVYEDIDEDTWEEEGPGRLMSGPVHVGMRRYAGLSKDEPLDDE